MSLKLDRIHANCRRGGHCHSIYRRLGYAKGPSVTKGVLVAFGIPIVAFIATLAVAAGVLGGFTAELNWPTALALLIAVAVTAAVVLVIWRLTQQPVDHSDASGSER